MGDSASDPMDLDNLAAVPDVAAAALKPASWCLPKQVRDEYKTYIEGDRILKTPDNLFEWWNGQSHVPSVPQMAFDLLSIPATSCECERVFSGAKKTISDYRGRLGADIIEALECDGAWLRAKV